MLPQRYKLLARAAGPTKAIHSLAVSKDGKFLASAGSDGLHMWKLPSLDSVPCSQQTFLQGPLTSQSWVASSHAASRNTLICGSARGYISFWRQVDTASAFAEKSSTRIGSGAEITCMMASQRDGTIRLAVGTRDRLVQVWTVDSSYQMNSVFCVELKTTVPKSVFLIDNSARDVRVFGLYDGKMVILRGDNGTVQVTKELGTQIGFVSMRGKLAVIDNVESGFDLRNIDTAEIVQQYKTRAPIARVPKQVLFGENGQVVVGASDHGAIYIFDRRSGAQREVLHHEASGLVQTIAVHDGEDSTLVFGATSGLAKTIRITIWTRQKAGTSGPGVIEKIVHQVTSWTKFAILLGMFLCTLTLIFQITPLPITNALLKSPPFSSFASAWTAGVPESVEVPRQGRQSAKTKRGGKFKTPLDVEPVYEINESERQEFSDEEEENQEDEEWDDKCAWNNEYVDKHVQ